MLTALRDFECSRCGFQNTSHKFSPLPYRPWHLRGRQAVKDYLSSLGAEAEEWLLALYVDTELNLLMVDTIAQGTVSSCVVRFPRILLRGHELGAAGFILVHNHPSGDPTPSAEDFRTTARLRRTSEEMELPLLDHFIVARDAIRRIGEW